ncbi:MAG: TlpA family protein disulfide reductase [Thiotrichales bacterium]|nr:MAG: TlpA family protein disulfide reductase [Thiotrichales bacterium]
MHLNNSLNNKLLTLALLAALSTLVALSAYAAWDVQPKLGHQLTPLPKPVPAPDFTLEDMDEEKHSLSDLRGKVVLLNFWATWCPPCRREMPSMERLHQKLDADNFKVIAINQMEDGDHVFAYIGQLEVDPTFTILFDSDSKVSTSYSVNGLPTTYLIDKQGNIRFRAIGGREFDHPEVEKQIMQLMQE